jgi:hypothetical protein
LTTGKLLLLKRRTVLLSPRLEGADPPAPHTEEHRCQAPTNHHRNSSTDPAVSRRHLQEGDDARAPPPPKSKLLGFHPRQAGQRRGGIYLNIAMKERSGAIDIMVAAVGQGFPLVQSPATSRTYHPPERLQGR